MPDMQDDIGTANRKIIAASLEANQKAMEDLGVGAFNQANVEFDKWQSENMQVPLDEKFHKYQECLLRHMFKAMAEGFQKGFIAGMNAAFDIVDAKTMELSGPPDHLN